MSRIKKILLFLVLLLVVAAGATFYLWRGVALPYRGFTGEQFVVIDTGSSVSGIGQALANAGVVRDLRSFQLAARLTGAERRMQAGEYRFDDAATALEVVNRIARGDVYTRPITFPEGRTAAEMAAIFAERTAGGTATFLTASRDVSRVAAFDPLARDLEGYLFPSTYLLPRKATAATLVDQMVQSFDKSFDADLRAGATAVGFTMREAVTMASLVEEEAQVAAERPMISAVYHNRLKIGMGLQCDATVIYAMQRAGTWNGNITRADLAMDSPYNTYRYRGLPPGPIANPGRASLEAAVKPADVPYLYYVSRNDGSHAFATTLDEHNRNVQQYQIQYFRDRRH
ncbi:MAG: endolytic transglycosylase MltG [Acidobacteriota bacterium]|nr:endolytic transglycosylase MltG [Acidobacteriota bacterium]